MSSLLTAPPDSPTWLLTVFFIFLLAGTVKGVLGFGMPTVAMALLGFMMPPQRAAALLIIPSIITNVWQIFAGPPLTTAVRRAWPLLLTIAIGTVIGVVTLGTRLGGGATVLLGLVLATYGVIGLAAVQLTVPTRAQSWLAPIVGLTTGLLNAATGVSVIPLVPYLGALGLAKDDLVQTLGLCFLVAIIALGTGLTLTMEMRFSAANITVPLLASLAGMGSGQLIRRRISADVFRRVFLIALVLIGTYLAIHAA